MKFLILMVLFFASTTFAWSEGRINYKSGSFVGSGAVFHGPTFKLYSGEEANFMGTADSAAGVCKLLGYNFLAAFERTERGSDNHLLWLMPSGKIAAFLPGESLYPALSTVACYN